MAHGYFHTFPALRGVQAGREYYVAMCPLALLPKIFLFDESPVPAELRAQRTLNSARVPEIARYIVENRAEYAFSAITASIDGEVRFEPAVLGDGPSDAGQLRVPMSTKFVINDGQHRRAAIEKALEEQPDLGEETIAVVFYLDRGLDRSQQLFADLNKHAVRPSKSIGILYDYRDPLARLARDLADSVFCFKGLTEMEKSTISNRSIKLFTLSGISQATDALLGKASNAEVADDEKHLAHKFWTELGRLIPEWGLAAERLVSSAELRRDFVHAHSVGLHAIGLAGHALVTRYPHDWTTRLRVLQKLDWSRRNAGLWEGRAMVGGQMSKARQNLLLTTNLLKQTLGLPLAADEAQLEALFTGTPVDSPRTSEDSLRKRPGRPRKVFG